MQTQAQDQSAPPAPAADRGGSVKNLLLAALCVLNVVLLASLMGPQIKPNTAEAGAAIQGARPSDYIMIPTRSLGMNQDTLHILDTQNGAMVVAVLDPNNNRISFTAPMRLDDLFR